MSSLQKKLLCASVLPPKPDGKQSRFQPRKKDYSAIPWSKYFDTDKEIKVPESRSCFHYYQKGEPVGPIIVLLHGGGFSGLTWALFAQSLTNIVECCCIAVDQRGHGFTSTDDDSNLSANRLADDVGEVVTAILKDASLSSNPVVLIGHSMGGAIAVHAAAKDKVPNLIGLIVIDVVEGSALGSLHAMRGVLSNRPKTFETIEKANEWCIRTGYIRNTESARISMIGQLKKIELPIESKEAIQTRDTSNRPKLDDIAESEDSSDQSPSPSTVSAGGSNEASDKPHRFEWRIDLSKTGNYWEGWFKGMSAMFLSINAPKLLLLAGVDRLDAAMTTAQMQGKFQMQIVARSGHVVHEDAPDKVAEVVAGFLIRHKFASAIGEFKRPMPAC